MAPDADRLFHGLALTQQRRLTVAVSGGSDSLSLLFMIRAFLMRHAPGTPLLAVTVDHGLRREAADEARRVGALCDSFGIAHRTLIWTGDKPATGIISAAREARYELLAQAAEDFGADCVLTGHTMDDQAETVAMRAERGSGAGLAGMARATLFDGRMWIVRPLLTVRRQALRDFLTQLDIKWIDDPSNENRSFERVRARSALAGTGAVEAIAAQAVEAGAARRTLSRASGLLIEHHASMPAHGLFRLERAFFDEDMDAVVYALRALLATAGGTPYLPDVARTRALVDAIRSGAALRVSLSRAVVDARKGAIWIRREARGLPTRGVLTGSGPWDGRWRFSVNGLNRPPSIAPLGQMWASELAVDGDSAPKSVVVAALSTEPAVFVDEEFIRHPADDDSVQAVRVVSPFARFLPDFDLVLAALLALCMGEELPPDAPFKDHIGTGT